MSTAGSGSVAVVLDYGTFKAALSGAHPSVISRLRRERDAGRRAGISAVLWFAAGKAWERTGHSRLLDAFLRPAGGLSIVPFDQRMAILAIKLLREDDRLGDFDAVSIATASVLKRPLAAMRRSQYSRRAGLAVEDWDQVPG